MRTPLVAAVVLATAVSAPLSAQAPAPPAAVRQPQPPPPPPGQGPRRGIAPMTLSSPAWVDGGVIPAAHTQAGDETSPPLAWGDVPDGVEGFVLVVHDLDAAIGDGSDDLLHWLVWNIPGDARALPAGVAPGDTVPALGNARQISATGPNYRGPGALAAGPAHHYVFELYALDTTINVPAGGASPLATRAAVVDAMKGHVRGKGVYTGRFKRGPTP